MGSAVQDIRKRLALAFPWLTQVIAYGSRVAAIQDGERAILMEDIKIDELNVILKEALKAVGFGTATVRAQRYVRGSSGETTPSLKQDYPRFC
jgi:hypothetical protein